MRLDMYLDGEIYFDGLSEEQLKTQPIGHIFRLGYWRNHPDLHGFITQNFADDVDGCDNSSLIEEDLLEIIEAIQDDRLPHTTGFFFGESSNDDEQKSQAIEIFTRAIAWLSSPETDEKSFRQVVYRACW